jgi:hypothetical protein
MLDNHDEMHFTKNLFLGSKNVWLQLVQGSKYGIFR